MVFSCKHTHGGQCGACVTGRRFLVVVFLLTFAVAVGIYMGSLHGPYVFDDLQAFGGELDAVAFPPVKHWLAPETRPLLQAWFWFVSGISTVPHVGYRIAGVLLHAMNVTLMFLLMSIVSRRVWGQAKRPALRNQGCVAGALWLVHPVCVQAVCSIVQQAELLMSMFFLCYLIVIATSRGRNRWLNTMMAYLCLVFGIHSKVVMVAAVPVGILLDGLMTNLTVKQVLRANWQLHLVPLIGVLLLAIAMIPMLLAGRAGIGFGGDAPPPGTYLMSSFRSFACYLGLTFWPASLAIDRGPYFITTWYEGVPYMACFAIYAGLACCAWVTGFPRRPVRRCLGWLMLSPLLVLAPTSSIVPTADPLFEHRFYLPLAFVISAVVFGGYELFVLRLGHMRGHRRVAVALLVLVLAGLAARSSVRARDYATSIQIWRSALMVDADNARASQNFVASLQDAELDADVVSELTSLIVYADTRGQRVDALAHQLAKAHLRQAEPHVALPILMELTKRATPAEKLLTDRQRREVGERWFDLAVASAQLGRATEGVQAIRQTLLATPNDPIAHAMAGDLLSAVGDREAAERHWQMSQYFSPGPRSRGSEGR